MASTHTPRHLRGREAVEPPPPRRPLSRAVAALAAALVLVVAAAGAWLTLRDEQAAVPIRADWQPVGSRVGDPALREAAWRAWAERDPSVRREQVVLLLATDWTQADRSVVVLAMPYPDFVAVATFVVRGTEAERVTRRQIGTDQRYLTDLVDVDGATAVVALAAGAVRTVVTTAAVGVDHADEIAVPGDGGAFLPVAAGRTATRVVFHDGDGAVIADRIPGSDLKNTPPLPLVLRERVEDGWRSQVRTGGDGLECKVMVPAGHDAPVSVDCP